MPLSNFNKLNLSKKEQHFKIFYIFTINYPLLLPS